MAEAKYAQTLRPHCVFSPRLAAVQITNRDQSCGRAAWPAVAGHWLAKSSSVCHSYQDGYQSSKHMELVRKERCGELLVHLHQMSKGTMLPAGGKQSAKSRGATCHPSRRCCLGNIPPFLRFSGCLLYPYIFMPLCMLFLLSDLPSSLKDFLDILNMTRSEEIFQEYENN